MNMQNLNSFKLKTVNIELEKWSKLRISMGDVRNFTTRWLQMFKQGNVNLCVSQKMEYTFVE